MKRCELALLAISAILLCAGAICFFYNLDIYRAVENTHPAKGFTEFVSQLSDDEFVLRQAPQWENSSSWVLRDLHQFLTDETVPFNSFSLLFTQSVITFAYYYGFACLPFLILVCVRMWQRSREKKEVLSADE